MSTDSQAVAVARKPRTRVAKSSGRQVAKPIKTAVYLSPDSMRRLAITSVMEGRTQSDLVDELIQEHLRRYVVSTRATTALEGFTDQATQEASAAA